jgi:hypothetical protein
VTVGPVIAALGVPSGIAAKSVAWSPWITSVPLVIVLIVSTSVLLSIDSGSLGRSFRF